MNKEFDKVAKKMPYTIPDGLFDDIEKNVMQRVEGEPFVMQTQESSDRFRAHSINLRPRYWMSAAACALVLIIGGLTYALHQEKPTDMDAVELAYDQLSDEDQMMFLALSEDDIFLTEEND